MFKVKRNYTRCKVVPTVVEIFDVLEKWQLNDVISAMAISYGDLFPQKLSQFIEQNYEGGLDAFYQNYKAES